jgi:uncharacterized protein
MSAPLMSAADTIARLSLQPHPEGGWYREIYRSRQRVHTSAGARSALTDIYYLLERSQQSRWHVVDADEAWHFYAGAPLQLYLYDPVAGALTAHRLGTPDVVAEPAAAGEPLVFAEPAAVVSAGVWQAARSLGDFSLVGCSVAPGFEFSGFRFVADLPEHARHFHAPSPLQSLRDLL